MPRPDKCRCICSLPRFKRFTPERSAEEESVVIGYDEYEVMRLIDYVGYSQAECATRMQISRPTCARLYKNLRNKISQALVDGKNIVFAGGNISVCKEFKPECIDNPYCCHRLKLKQENKI